MTAAIYARSATEEEPTAQLERLRTYCRARGWAFHEYVDRGVSGAKTRRPGLDALMQAVRGHDVAVVVCTKLDRLALSLEHLVALGGEFKALSVDLMVLDQAMDTTTSAGREILRLLAVLAEVERDLVRERAFAGLQRAKALGKRVGRPRSQVGRDEVLALRAAGFSYRAIGRRLRISAALAHRLVHGLPSEDRQGRSLSSSENLETGTRI
ncbi:MAG: hypothetical protein A3I14_02205 [Candidatus Rokubacteria bacterium RIFCSPLOWO2_02_FULL_73_56]|nr:MAG: hypothetical protein A3I14_02205 [Candidatus Rokubacteria bacterium RIFCSPLOWO2_02_FULL_73_56]